MTPDHIAAQDRVAPASDHVLTGPVTLMNSFAVSPGRDEAFQKRYAQAAADPEEWRRFTEQYLQHDEAAYQKAIR